MEVREMGEGGAKARVLRRQWSGGYPIDRSIACAAISHCASSFRKLLVLISEWDQKCEQPLFKSRVVEGFGGSVTVTPPQPTSNAC